MWIAIAVALMASGELQTAAAPVTFATEAQCRAANVKVEQNIKSAKEIKAYALVCREIKPDDVKAGGQDA